MFRALITGVAHRSVQFLQKAPTVYSNAPTLISRASFHNLIPTSSSPLLNPVIQNINYSITRSLIKFSWQKGKRKSVRSVPNRFYRLHWGGWIRTKAGRHKKLWKKHFARRRRLEAHVFCNAKQNTLLDKMVTSFWRRPKYYVDDPYEPYHTREEFMYTYKKPKPYVP